METVNKICVALLIVGGLNWGLIGLFNFDAVGWLFGGTTALIFMGEMLNKSSRNVRATTSIIGFGTSEQVRKK